MQKRRLGTIEIAALGLGTGAMAEPAGGDYSDAESIATIQAALDAGIELLDTGDFYGMGHAELLLGEALRGRRDRAFVSLKYGALRDPGGHIIGFDARPSATKNFLAYSLRRLGTDYVDLLQPARVDPAVPIEDTVGAIADLVKAGHVRHIGLSEVGPGTIARACAVHPIVAVEAEYSLLGRDIEENVLPAAREHGLGLVAYSVLAGGTLAGRVHVPAAAPSRPALAASVRNLALVARFGELAAARGVTTTALAYAWVLAQGADIVPLAGARSRKRLADVLAALAITIGPADLAELDAAFPRGAAEGGIYAGFVLDMIRKERQS